MQALGGARHEICERGTSAGAISYPIPDETEGAEQRFETKNVFRGAYA